MGTRAQYSVAISGVLASASGYGDVCVAHEVVRLPEAGITRAQPKWRPRDGRSATDTRGDHYVAQHQWAHRHPRPRPPRGAARRRRDKYTGSGGSVLAPLLLAVQMSRPSSRGCATWAMSRASTSSWRTDGRRTTTSGSPTSRPSWSASRWTS